MTDHERCELHVEVRCVLPRYHAGHCAAEEMGFTLRAPEAPVTEIALDFEKALADGMVSGASTFPWPVDSAVRAALNAQLTERIAQARREAENEVACAKMEWRNEGFYAGLEQGRKELASLTTAHAALVAVVKEWQEARKAMDDSFGAGAGELHILQSRENRATAALAALSTLALPEDKE